ncbi:hypothetical protein [Flaviaesturariibacter terrae]
MRLLGCFLLLLGLMACSDGPKKEPVVKGEEGSSFSYSSFAGRFPKAALPYCISDTALQHSADTASLRYPEFTSLLPDSMKTALFGDGKPRYTPLARTGDVSGVEFFAVRASSGSQHVALLYRFEQEKFSALFPLLVPDEDEATTQTSSVDRSGTITRNVVKKMPKEQTAEGKDVYVYNPQAKGFTLILTDPLEDNQDVLNPIDTFGRKHPLAGDYVKGPRNFVSIRDARNPSEINFFVHFEKGEADNICSGEIKGTALLTSSRTAVYRQGGDPCVLELTFSGNSVTLREMEGCGSRRGVQCVFEGSFPRKKAVSPKNGGKKKARK